MALVMVCLASLAKKFFSFTVLKITLGSTVSTKDVIYALSSSLLTISLFLKISVVSISAFFEIPDLRFSTESLIKAVTRGSSEIRSSGLNLFRILRSLIASN
jgi:hypothetical protein